MKPDEEKWPFEGEWIHVYHDDEETPERWIYGELKANMDRQLELKAGMVAREAFDGFPCGPRLWEVLSIEEYFTAISNDLPALPLTHGDANLRTIMNEMRYAPVFDRIKDVVIGTGL